ncbi:acyltransferase family protein [Chitinophaga filiformis]|uniref:Peptidoglycan/LPS O-acetylase OafA/YrhL, contains acyltransferase and SGNH-hydrolase domains n=1 Tax=Chitinophaga filiformis TaxID=104663 RepID=A0A1G7RFC8_CHIFI|nr:acyltransferase [Chitinophaga filiformis]SDG09487.1 Peptidoglycan/LPS O-acetylase OafA/YrhL, contains acyltransferase and SGNH-hydrolase domains [Chitinophaga filiformis]
MMTKRPRLEFLDGIRGLCALYVAFYHAVFFTGNGIEKTQFTGVFKPLTYLLEFGHYSVAVFIVLSGFCLTIPVALSENRDLRGGFKTYIRRRAHRILPPYYFALLFSLLLIWALPLMQTPHDTAWDSKLPVKLESIVTHLLLVHNIHTHWIFKINGPLWSVATEWQIYFTFPVLLLLWRRYGLGAATAAAVIVGILPELVLPHRISFWWLHPWYLGLFGIGMAAAIVAFDTKGTTEKVKRLFSNGWIVSGLVALVIAILAVSKPLSLSLTFTEVMVGLAVSAVIVYYTLKEHAMQGRPLLLRFLNGKVAVGLGAFSYSIYLIHSPILAAINLYTLNLQMTDNMRLLFMLLVAVPVSVLLAHVFYLLVERRFLNMPPKAAATPATPVINVSGNYESVSQ